MKSVRAALLRILASLNPRQRERDMNEELESHLLLHIDDNLRSGMTSDEARRQALAQLGGLQSAKESYRERRAAPLLEAAAKDMRYALREIRRAPGFAAVAVLTLALGIGANTAIFSVVHSVLIEPLPFQDPDRLAILGEVSAKLPNNLNVDAPSNIIRWKERAASFSDIAAYDDWRANLIGPTDPEEIIAQDVTSNFFSTLGVEPLIGRTFAPDEGPDGHDGLVVLSYSLWQRRFGGDASVLERQIQLNTRLFQVIGVMPPDSELFVKPLSLTGRPPELWTVFAFTGAMRNSRGRYMAAVGRLKPNVTVSQAQAEMNGIAAGLQTEFPELNKAWTVRLVPVREALAGSLRTPLLVLSIAVGFVLLIGCTNVASLLLARGAARQYEIALRGALGASRSRIVRQFLTESLVLGMSGGLVGLLVAFWGVRLLMAIAPTDLTRQWHPALHYPVLAFTAIVSLLTAVLCGTAPALEASRVDVQDSLRESGRVIGSALLRRRMRHALIVSQFAICLVLLAGAGSMLRSLARVRALNPGFDAGNTLTFRLTLPSRKYPDTPEGNAKVIQFFQQTVARLRTLPGVRDAGTISFLPFTANGAATDFSINGKVVPADGQRPVADVRVADNGYFRVMKVPLIRGRWFSEREMNQPSGTIIINETMAKLYFPGEDPIGKAVTISMRVHNAPSQIIGVVGDVHQVDLTTEPRATVYWPHPELVMNAMTLMVRTETTSPLQLVPSVVHEVQAMDKDLPVAEPRTMEQWVARSLEQARFQSILLTTFAVLALVLSGTGIYGVMSCSVSERTSEIGIRGALGARGSEIRRMIVGNAVVLMATGMTIGLPVAAMAAHSLAILVYAPGGGNYWILPVAAALLAAVGVAASYIPARRAAKVLPLEAIRHR